jgi:hypothetical protein
MSERIDYLMARLDKTRALLDSVLDQVGGQVEAQVYSDGLGWTVRQLAIHLADAERGQHNVAVNIADGRDIVPPDFDIERYNRRITEKLDDKTFEQARQELAESRHKLKEWLRTLSDEQLDRAGRHASQHILTVEQFVKVIGNHERDHANDIARALGIAVAE